MTKTQTQAEAEEVAHKIAMVNMMGTINGKIIIDTGKGITRGSNGRGNFWRERVIKGKIEVASTVKITLEGGVGSCELSDRGGGRFSRYTAYFQGRKRNGDLLPWSQATPAADGDEGGGPLWGIHWPTKSYTALDWEHHMEILVRYGIRSGRRDFPSYTGNTFLWWPGQSDTTAPLSKDHAGSPRYTLFPSLF